MDDQYLTQRTRDLNEQAREAANQVRRELGETGILIGAVLGTGWGDSVTPKKTIDLAQLFPSLEKLGQVPGHAAKIGIAKFGGRRVLAQSGRVHMYQGDRDAVYLLARLHWELGVRKLILTSAVGGMRNFIRKGDIVSIADFAPYISSPVDGPPFPIPSQMIREKLMQNIYCDAPVARVHIGYSATNQGPALESELARRVVDGPGILCVGMSGYPEALCYASFVEQAGLKTGKHAFVVPIACVSNGLNDPHGHADNQAAMKTTPLG